jgi:hypothetical protein
MQVFFVLWIGLCLAAMAAISLATMTGFCNPSAPLATACQWGE